MRRECEEESREMFNTLLQRVVATSAQAPCADLALDEGVEH